MKAHRVEVKSLKNECFVFYAYQTALIATKEETPCTLNYGGFYMAFESKITVPGKIFLKRYQGIVFRMGKVPSVKLTLEYDQTAKGSIKGLKIADDLSYNSDVLDNIQPLAQERFVRNTISVISRPGQKRVSAYLLSTRKYKVFTEIQLRHRWTKKGCSKETPAGSARPWAKKIYQYRARHVFMFEFKIDREIEKFTAGSWAYEKVEEDPRKWRKNKPIEGSWTSYKLLKPLFRAAPCVEPGEDVRYRQFEIMGATQKIDLYKTD